MKSFISLFLISLSALATTGDEIIESIKKHNAGYGSEKAEVILVISESGKTLAERKMKVMNIELNNDYTSKSYLEFIHPADVKGTKLLTWLHRKEEKSQWVYLPALNKKRRILSGNQNSSFMGSEFTYEDIGGRETSHYLHKLLEEKKDGQDIVWKIEQRPRKSSSSAYEIITLKKSLMGPVKVEYFNERNEKIKESEILEYQKFNVNGRTFYRPSLVTMKNLITGKESSFRWLKRKYAEKIKDSDFNPALLDTRK